MAPHMKGPKDCLLVLVVYQPANEPHVNGCASETACMFFISFKGALGMKPVEKAAEVSKSTEILASKVAWKPVIADKPNGPMMAVVNGNPKEGPFMAMAKFPAGFSTNVHSHTANFAGALISGTHHRGPSAEKLATLPKGSVWSEKGGAPHMEKCGEKEACIFVFAMDGKIDNIEAALKDK